MIELPSNTGEILAVYGFASGGADACDSVWWRTDNRKIRFFAECSDTFGWATADAEPIEEGDEVLLRQCLEDLKSYDETYLISELFAARKRKMRPMRLWLGIHPSATHQNKQWKSLQLFLDAGPERDPKTES